MQNMKHIIVFLLINLFLFSYGVQAIPPNPELDALFVESDAFFGQGKYEQAIKKANEVLKNASKEYKEPNVYAAEAYQRIALSYQASGKFNEAETNYVNSEEVFSRLTPPESYRMLNLTGNFGEFYLDYGKYEQAIAKFERIFRALEWYPNFKDPIAVRLLNGLGTCYAEVGKYSESEEVYKRVILLCEQSKQNQAGNCEASLIGLGFIELRRKNLDGAEKLYQQALASLEKREDRNSSKVTRLINGAKTNLAMLYEQKGDKKRAQDLLLESTQGGGKGYVGMLDDLGNDYMLATNLYSQGLRSEAKPLLETIVNRASKMKGVDPKFMIRPLGSLALVYMDENDYEKAKPLLEKALKIAGQTEDIHVSHVCPLMNQLAAVYEHEGKTKEAESYYLQAIDTCENKLSEGEIAIAIMTINLAKLYQNLERYDDAEKFFLKALKIRKKAYGEKHKDISDNFYDLAELYNEMGKYELAEKYYKDMLALDEDLSGGESLEVANSLNELGLFYEAQKRYEESEVMYKKALRVREKLLKPDAIELTYSLSNLASLYQSWGKPELAEPLCERELKIEEKILGKNHEDTLDTRDKLIKLRSQIIKNKKISLGNFRSIAKNRRKSSTGI